MNPVELIKRDLEKSAGQRGLMWWGKTENIRFNEELSIFTKHKIYVVQGRSGEFDFPGLPHGSYGFYAANGWEAIHLTRAGKEIERLLATEWPHLHRANPVRLAFLILGFFDAGILASHDVLANAADLRSMCEPPSSERHFDEVALAEALPEIGETSCVVSGDVVILRAVTLCGWMHTKTNLGIEVISIHQDGTVELSERRVLAEKVFDQVPGIMY